MAYKNKIWLVGRSGRLGAALEAILAPQFNNSTIGTDENEVDITNLREVENFVDQVNPDIIIDCAGKSDRNWCEENPDDCFSLHAIGARNLAIAANRHNIHIFYLSSDFVFDGTSTKPYTEFDIPNPQTVYGKSKLDGEQFVRTLCPKHTILRSSWMYGKRYLNEILKQASTGKVTIDKNIIGTPTSSLELAETIIRFFNTNEYGTFHISCEGEASLKDFIFEVLKIANVKAEIVEEVGSISRFESLRPRYSVLDNYMLRLMKHQPMSDWKEALFRFMSECKVIK